MELYRFFEMFEPLVIRTRNQGDCFSVGDGADLAKNLRIVSMGKVIIREVRA